MEVAIFWRKSSTDPVMEGGYVVERVIHPIPHSAQPMATEAIHRKLSTDDGEWDTILHERGISCYAYYGIYLR